MAVPFDARTGRTTGPPVPVLEGVSLGLAGAAKLAVSRNGWAVYFEASTRQRRLTMVDRRGIASPVAFEPQAYSDPRISPNGRDVAVTVLRPGGGLAGDIWVLNLARATRSRVTFEGSDQFPDWSGDGQRVAYNTLRGRNGVYWKPVGGGSAELLADSAGGQIFEAIVTHDARRVIYRVGGIPGDLYSCTATRWANGIRCSRHGSTNARRRSLPMTDGSPTSRTSRAATRSTCSLSPTAAVAG